MGTSPALPHEVWERTPPKAQAYIRALEARVETMVSMVYTLQEQVYTLQDQLNQASQHSSRPPSSDPPQHRQARRPRSQRSRGGQPGHPGHTHTLIPVEEVDEVVVLKPEQCTHCQAPLSGDDPKPLKTALGELETRLVLCQSLILGRSFPHIIVLLDRIVVTTLILRLDRALGWTRERRPRIVLRLDGSRAVERDVLWYLGDGPLQCLQLVPSEMGQDLMTITHCFSARWVDLGVKHLATLSTGEKIEGPKPLKAALHHLRRVNRQLARASKGRRIGTGRRRSLDVSTHGLRRFATMRSTS
jgi:Family of unknown function (DUF6444)